MPKVVDHEERRRELAQAVWRVVARDGVHRASVRTIAAESGWSTGSLRHYFPSQDALLLFAINLVADRVRGRVQQNLSGSRSVADVLRRFAQELLPLDEERRTEGLVWLALMSRMQVDTDLGRAERENREALLNFLSVQLWRAAAEGELRAGLDPALESFRLLATIDGLTLHGLLAGDQIAPDELLAVVDRHLAELVEPGEH